MAAPQTAFGQGQSNRTERSASQPAPAPRDARADQSHDALLAEEDADVDLLELDVPTVVTAARHPQPVRTVPYAVSIITAEDIRRAGARNVPDALRLAAGVDVAELGYGHAAVSPRGFHGATARQTLVLVDGRQLFDLLFGGTLWGGWPFQLEDIDRIEVIRGPGGVTWGANAMNGVINVITKDPAQQKGLTSVSRGGSRGTYQQYFGYAFADERFRLRVSSEIEGSDGFERGGSRLAGLDDEYRGYRGDIHGIVELDERNSLLFSAASGVLEHGFARTPQAGLTGPRRSDAQANSLLGRWTHTISADNTLQWTAFVNDYHFSPGLRAVDYRYQQFALQFSHTFKPAPAHTLSWGMDSRVDIVDATNSDPFLLTRSFVDSGIVGLYAQDDWRLADRWTLSLGGRVDYDTYGGFEPSGRAALTYEINEHHVVYGAVSRAFQMPPAALRFLNLPLLDGIARTVADQDVEAQTLVAYELGYRGRSFEDRLQLGLNGFWHEYWDLTTLGPRLGPPGLLKFVEDNRASASLYGFELEAKFAVTPRWSLLGNYTYQQLDWDSSSPLHEKDAVSPPKHKFMLGTRYSLTDDLHLSSHAYWVDAVTAPNAKNPFLPRQLASYWRLDLRAEYEFWEDRASLSAGVRNLLDSHHPEGGSLFHNFAEVPRMFYAELRISID